MMQSSIRFSLVGEHVGWTTKMSRARTFCSISTSTSPSEKRPTLALPRSIAQVRGDVLRQRRVGVAGEEDGVEQHGTDSGGRLIQREIWQGRKDSNPRMSESKSDALTNLATPLHRCAARAAHLRTHASLAAPAQAASGWRCQRAAHPARPARGPIARHRCRWRRRRSPARAKTALPEPVIRLLPKRALQARPPRARPRGKAPRPRPAGRCARSPRRVDRLGFPCAPARHRRRNGLGKARDSSSVDALGDLRAGEDLARVARPRRA